VLVGSLLVSSLVVAPAPSPCPPPRERAALRGPPIAASIIALTVVGRCALPFHIPSCQKCSHHHPSALSLIGIADIVVSERATQATCNSPPLLLRPPPTHTHTWPYLSWSHWHSQLLAQGLKEVLSGDGPAAQHSTAWCQTSAVTALYAHNKFQRWNAHLHDALSLPLVCVLPPLPPLPPPPPPLDLLLLSRVPPPPWCPSRPLSHQPTTVLPSPA
jgi:hypothetical protein